MKGTGDDALRPGCTHMKQNSSTAISYAHLRGQDSCRKGQQDRDGGGQDKKLHAGLFLGKKVGGALGLFFMGVN